MTDNVISIATTYLFKTNSLYILNFKDKLTCIAEYVGINSAFQRKFKVSEQFYEGLLDSKINIKEDTLSITLSDKSIANVSFKNITFNEVEED